MLVWRRVNGAVLFIGGFSFWGWFFSESCDCFLPEGEGKRINIGNIRKGNGVNLKIGWGKELKLCLSEVF